MLRRKMIKDDPLVQLVAAVSVGVYKGVPVLDLDYPEDSAAETDMNIVMGQHGGFIEIQGTAEGAPFTREQADAMMVLGQAGITTLVETQKKALGW